MNNINNRNLSNKNQKGFTLMELAVATVLTIIVVVILFSITTTGLKNGRFVEKLTDTSNLLSKKLADIYRDIPNEVKKLKDGEMQLGSINPATPIPG
ncbi:MAG: prepilin-type N-terminal cleavage/methylation domain-containing protein, partial [Blastocatellia bacterium]